MYVCMYVCVYVYIIWVCSNRTVHVCVNGIYPKPPVVAVVAWDPLGVPAEEERARPPPTKMQPPKRNLGETKALGGRKLPGACGKLWSPHWLYICRFHLFLLIVF